MNKRLLLIPLPVGLFIGFVFLIRKPFPDAATFFAALGSFLFLLFLSALILFLILLLTGYDGPSQ